MEWLSKLPDWLPWITLTGGIFAVVASLLGVTKVLGILEKAIDIVSPVLKLVFEAVAAGLKGFWNLVMWPAKREDGTVPPSFRRGLGDICDDWVTILTVASICGALWFYMDLKVDNVVDQLSFCQSENMRLERLAKREGLVPSPAGPFDWLWKW